MYFHSDNIEKAKLNFIRSLKILEQHEESSEGLTPNEEEFYN